jgi:multiple antibiotic resistance protein
MAGEHASLTNVADATRAAALAVATLIPIVNPLGSAPICLAMSADLPTVVRRRLPRQIAWNSFLLLAAAMLVGSHILELFAISVPIVRVGGGLLVVATGWRLLNANDIAVGATRLRAFGTERRRVARSIR